MKPRLMPDKPGFYWARCLHEFNGSRDSGGDDCYCLGPANEWVIVQVYVDDPDPKSEEHMMAFIPGRNDAYPLEDFRWGKFVADERPIKGVHIHGEYDGETGKKI